VCVGIAFGCHRLFGGAYTFPDIDTSAVSAAYYANIHVR
jgi:hypothetical protein